MKRKNTFVDFISFKPLMADDESYNFCLLLNLWFLFGGKTPNVLIRGWSYLWWPFRPPAPRSLYQRGTGRGSRGGWSCRTWSGTWRASSRRPCSAGGTWSRCGPWCRSPCQCPWWGRLFNCFTNSHSEHFISWNMIVVINQTMLTHQCSDDKRKNVVTVAS